MADPVRWRVIKFQGKWYHVEFLRDAEGVIKYRVEVCRETVRGKNFRPVPTGGPAYYAVLGYAVHTGELEVFCL